MRVIGYTRVSTDKQDNSAQAQENRIRAWTTARQWDLLDVIVDIDEFSGDLDRPGAQKVLEMVRAKSVDGVIIVKLDRMTRSTRDALDLVELFNKKGVAFVSIEESIDTKSPIGEFFLTVMAALAQLERKMIGSRTKAGLDNLKAKGCPAGPPPYGWSAQPRTQEERQKRISKPLVPNPDEVELIQRVRAWRSSGMGLQQIADRLNEAGHRTRRGGPWVFQLVAALLKNRTLVGDIPLEPKQDRAA